MINATIHVNGSCVVSTQIGGWAFIIDSHGVGGLIDGMGAEPDTTANQMELTAAIEALRNLPPTNGYSSVTLCSKSQYLVDNASARLSSWKENDWKKADGKPVENKTLWQDLDLLQSQFEVNWKWLDQGTDSLSQDLVDFFAREQSGGKQNKKKLRERAKALGFI